ncbi:hypothetical protein [Palleronia sp. LCG004]|uniref:hypothetical protein n=1 Tax=Palleronia sp. LCG004 TaxID=3079304 RepID=UPI00294281BC|nr:hypothetical protein [Palleronia sp. LCG004]WOI57630.1 hypothetical protein RVY76_13675 [Palleronia sp. LCG004]
MDFLQAFDALPQGAFDGWADDRKYNVVKSRHSGGRSEKLFAREAGGRDHVSLNLYRLSDGSVRLFPCEMPREKVVRFVLDLKVGA